MAIENESVPMVSPLVGDGAEARQLVRVGGWDLVVLRGAGESEPRVRDIDLAERLGYERPRKVRELIERSRAELERFGPVHCRPAVGRQSTGNGGEREYEAEEAWLTEPQALLVAVLSRTEKAANVREGLIRAFVAARDGLLPRPVDPAIGVALVRLSETLDRMEARLVAVEHGGGMISRVQLAGIRTGVAEAARGCIAAGLRPSLRSANRWVYNRLGGAVGWTGAGRSWARLPSSLYADVVAELAAIQREMATAVEAVACERQRGLFAEASKRSA